jgi:chromosome segregation ATPase
MTRTFRERPRYAVIVGVGLLCLVGLGVLAGFLLGGGADSSSDEPSAAEVRQAQRLRALRLELSEAREELAAARDEVEAAAEQGERRQARIATWRRRAQQLERQNRVLRRQLAQAQEEQQP